MRKFGLLICLIILNQVIIGQILPVNNVTTPCGCDHTVSQSGIYIQSTTPGAFNLNVLPGQTVCIQSGNYTLLRFRNFVGTASNPIIFKNCGGLVTIGHSSYYAALNFQNCRYFKITGAGDPSVNYGFRVDSSGTATAMSVDGLSSDCEVDHIEIAKAGFAGIMAKTDPGCDPATWRENFTMYNVNIHDNYVHDVAGEGFYAGNSFFGSGMTFDCSGTTTTAFPHNIINLKIHHNIVRRSGAECLQYACAPNAQVYNNDLDRCGISPFASFQNNGLQCGGGAGGDCYNNQIRNVGGSGLAIIGHLGNNRFYNNLIVNAKGDAIFCDDHAGSLSNTYCDFINNTIVNSGRDAFRLYNQNNTILLSNNAIVGIGKYEAGICFNFQQGATATQRNNYCSTNLLINGVFADTINYRPSVGSSLINSGNDVSSYGITYDIEGRSRPIDDFFDIGAYEFSLNSLPLELLDFQGFISDKNNHLTWHIAQADDLKSIEIQKSADGKNFTPLSILTKNQFDFLDKNPFELTYYRLKINDLNGKSFFSKTIALTLGEDQKRIKVTVAPNPANGFLTIHFENTKHKAATLNVFNANGQLVFMQKKEVFTNEEKINTEGWASGIYFLKIKIGKEMETVRFLKQ